MYIRELQRKKRKQSLKGCHLKNHFQFQLGPENNENNKI
jgi:hypothetical protein